MSRLITSGNASGTGSVTLESPNTNSDRTISLPDADGTMVYADASGNVGIGTDNPNQTGFTSPVLSVTNGTSGVLELIGTQASDGTVGQVAFYNTSGTTRTSQILGLRSGANNSGALTFQTNDSGSLSERMRIDSSGNLLVGTTNATEHSGTTGAIVAQHSAGVRVALKAVTSTTSAATLINLVNPNGAVGTIVTNGSGTTYNTSSDYRLKENIAPMTGALEKVASLKPVTYNWKVDGSSGQGFIAHELQEVVPECVTGEKDAVDADGKPVYQGIDTSFLVATLAKAIQELKEQVDAQALEIQALKGVA